MFLIGLRRRLKKRDAGFFKGTPEGIASELTILRHEAF
jgi:hypothetical protein